jgi:hypothetical protein
MRQIGKRRDLAWSSREYFAITALGTTRLADRIELQTEVVEQARVPGRKLKRSFENRDRGSRFVALCERVAQKEQQFGMARLELRRSAVDTRLRGGDVPARERGARFSKQGVCGNGRGQEVSGDVRAERWCAFSARSSGGNRLHPTKKDISAAHPSLPAASA